MNRKVLIALTMMALASMVSAAFSLPPQIKIASIDVGTGTEYGLLGWGPPEPATHGGYWGGISPGNCRVVYAPSIEGDGVDAEATFSVWHSVTNSVPMCFQPRTIELRVLDGIANDDFEVFIKTTSGEWLKVYEYESDPSTSEYWVDHTITLRWAFSFYCGEFKIKMCASGEEWWGLNTYGQLAVDTLELWGNEPVPPDFHP